MGAPEEHDAVRERLAPGLRDEVVFTFDGRPYTWADIAVASAARGTWAVMTAGAAAALDAERALDPALHAEAQAAVKGDGTAFRRARSLFTADEFTAWLARRHVSVDQWRDHLRRGAALRLRPTPVAEGEVHADPADGPDPDHGTVVPDDVVHVTAVLSGFLDSEATALAEDLALAPGVPGPGDERDDHLRLAVEEGERARRAVSEDERAIAELVGQHGVDWSHVRARVVTLDTEDAAEEVALCVRADGLALVDVAETAGATITILDTTLGESPAVLQGLFMGASAGDLVGPVDDDGRHLVAEVIERTPVTVDDPRTRERACAVLLRRAVDERGRTMVRWVWRD